MKLALQRSEDFNRDFDLQYQWYLERAGEAVAEHYLNAVLATLRMLATQPDLGAAGSSAIQFSRASAHSGLLLRLEFTWFSTATTPPSFLPNG